MLTIRVMLIVIMVVLAGVGCYSCTMSCPTVTGKRSDEGWFASKYLDLSNNTTNTVSIKQFNIYDIGDHYCG